MPIPIEEIRKWRRLISQGQLDQCLKEMQDYLPEMDGNTADTVTLLSGQLAGLRRQETLGIIDFSSANIQRNKITHGLLGLLSELEAAVPSAVLPPSPAPRPIYPADRGADDGKADDDRGPFFDPGREQAAEAEPPAMEEPATSGSEAPDETPEAQRGAILYQIPQRMQLEQESRCVVRLAFEADAVRRGMEDAPDVTVQPIRVEREMSVALIDPNEMPAFSIRSPGYDEIQAVEEGGYTEWVFRVKPLRAGAFPLLLKVSVVLFVEGRERRKNLVLEELVQVVATPVAEGTSFKSADALAEEPGLSLFISWSRSERDAPFCQDLVKQLAPLRLRKLLHAWEPAMAPPGVDRDRAVRARLSQAELFAVLISPDYLADADCFHELEAIQRQMLARDGDIVPIFIRSCNYEILPIGQLQVLPRSSRAIAQHDDTDAAWTEVVREIHQLVKKWETRVC